MIIDLWAQKWGINPAALDDLKRSLGVGEVVVQTGNYTSEAAAQADVRMEASEKGGRLWRNNVGAGHIAESGSFMRWGLCNESEAQNAHMKSSDLIGGLPVVIQPQHVGCTILQFTAREMKRPGWKFNPNDKREVGQFRFIELVTRLGGNAGFATGRGTL